MEEPFSHKLAAARESVQLSPQRKEALKQRLLAMIDSTADAAAPVSLGWTLRHSKQRPGLSLLKLIASPMPVLVAISLAVFVFGGTSLAAEGTVPGDALYPMKVNVNEKIVEALQFTSESRAGYEAQVAERRLEEAAELAVSVGVESDDAEELSERFTEHAEMVKEKVRKLSEGGEVRAAADVASRFEASLRAHQAILKKLEARGGSVTKVGAAVRTTLDDVANVRANLESSIAARGTAGDEREHRSSRSAVEKQQRSAIQGIQSLRARLASDQNLVASDSSVAVAAQLKVAEELAARSKVQADAGAYGEAFNLANRAVRLVEETRTLVEAEGRLKVDLGSSFKATSGGAAGAGAGASSQVSGSVDVTSTSIEADADGELEVEVDL